MLSETTLLPYFRLNYMKYLLFFTVTLLFSACTSYQVVRITPQSSVTIPTIEKSEYTKLNITNKSKKNLEAEIVTSEGQRTSSFGIAPRGNVEVSVKNNLDLNITNTSDQTIKLRYVSKKGTAPQKTAVEYVSFTLRNNSAKSIPLIIPTVMNPNLSPFSNSGVDLKIGQEILFKVKGKTYTLLTVDSSLADTTIDVASRLKERKKELGL